MHGHHRLESYLMIMSMLMVINMLMLNRPIWKMEAVIRKRMKFQILSMMFATWLEGLLCLAVVTPIVVVREKKENVLRFKLGKKKNSGIGLQLLLWWDQMVDSMSNNSNLTSISKDRKGCSILEVMTELHSIEEVNIDDDFHGFATEFLGLRRNRKLWSTISNFENKMKWLQRMYTRHKTP
ncbi:hypothetical protein Peur_023839 [Populus x canadensis]